VTAAVGAWVAVAGLGVCIVAMIVAAWVFTICHPCFGWYPRWEDPVLVMKGSVVGALVISVVPPLTRSGWTDVAVTAAVVGPLLAYAAVGGVGRLRDHRQQARLHVWAERDRADRDGAGVR